MNAETVDCAACAILADSLAPGGTETCPRCGAELKRPHGGDKRDGRGNPRRDHGSLDGLLCDAATIHAWRQRQGIRAVDLDPDKHGRSDEESVGSVYARERRQHLGYTLDNRLRALTGKSREVIEWLVVYGGPLATQALSLSGRRAGDSGWEELIGRWFHPSSEPKYHFGNLEYWASPSGRLSASTRGKRLLDACLVAWYGPVQQESA